MVFDEQKNEIFEREIITKIDDRIRQAVALANHIKNNKWYDAGYVEEKSTTTPALDKANARVHDMIREILLEEYGVDINMGGW